MRIRDSLLAGCAAVLTNCGSIAFAAPAPLTTEALAQPPSFVNPVLSPDGGKMLASLTVQRSTVLGIIGLDGQSVKTIGINDDQDLLDYWWAGDGKVIFTVGSRMEWYGRGERYVTRAFAYDLASGKAIPLGPKVQSEVGDDIIWIDPAGRSILMTSQPDQFTYPSVFRVSLDDGKPKLEQGPYDFGWDWQADYTGKVRFGQAWRANNWFTYYRKPGASGPAGQAPMPTPRKSRSASAIWFAPTATRASPSFQARTADTRSTGSISRRSSVAKSCLSTPRTTCPALAST